MNSDLLNYTPHEIVLFDPDTKEELVRIEPQKESIRLLQTSHGTTTHLIGTHIIRAIGPPIFYDISLMPPEGSSIIVSALVGEYLALKYPNHCKDVFAPDTSPAACVRDDRGRIMGTTQLVRYQ